MLINVVSQRCSSGHGVYVEEQHNNIVLFQTCLNINSNLNSVKITLTSVYSTYLPNSTMQVFSIVNKRNKIDDYKFNSVNNYKKWLLTPGLLALSFGVRFMYSTSEKSEHTFPIHFMKKVCPYLTSTVHARFVPVIAMKRTIRTKAIHFRDCNDSTNSISNMKGGR